MAEKDPIIIYGVYQESEVQVGFGYLMVVNGVPYCYPSEQTGEKFLGHFREFEIDLQLLREQADIGADRKLYLYPVVRGAPEGKNMLLTIQGCFQAH